MNILNNLTKKEQILIPFWLRAWIFFEWFYNKDLMFKSFGCAIALLIWAFQLSTEDYFNRWFVYIFRLISLVSALILAHHQIFSDTLTKLGF